jgi:hypothetical protein
MAGSKKVEIAEIASLIEKIKDGATGSKTPLSEVLRLCLRLGKQLDNKQLSSWALAELNGYKSIKDLPDYRIHSTQVLGHFSGPFGSGLRNAQIPQFTIEEDHREHLFTNYLENPVAELEDLTGRDKDDTLKVVWPADIVAYYQCKPIYERMVLNTAWRVVTKSTLQGVLDTIRTRVLEFVLNIEDELGINNLSNKKELEVNQPIADKVNQVFNTTINGGNVALGNSGSTVQNTIVVTPGDLSGFKKYLKDLGVTNELLNELEQALKKDEHSEKQPGPETSNWLSRVMIMIGQGSLSVASNTSGSLIATALTQYLGLKL